MSLLSFHAVFLQAVLPKEFVGPKSDKLLDRPERGPQGTLQIVRRPAARRAFVHLRPIGKRGKVSR